MVVNQLKVRPFQSCGFRWVNLHPYNLALVTRHAEKMSDAWRDGSDPGAEVEVLGVITVEDVLEELIGEEIYDEVGVWVYVCVGGGGTRHGTG